MPEPVEIWITVDCREPIRQVLLRQGVAMGNEYRFDDVSWKVLVTRTADLFLDVLRGAVERRLLAWRGDLELTWRTAIGPDELLLVPPTADRQRRMGILREVMAFLRDLLFERRFIATSLRAVLGEIIRRRCEDDILAGRFDRAATAERLVEQLATIDLAAEAPAGEAPAPAATTSTDDVAASPPADAEAEAPAPLRIVRPADEEPHDEPAADEPGETRPDDGPADAEPDDGTTT